MRQWFLVIPVVVLLVVSGALLPRVKGQAAATCTTRVLSNRAAVYAVSLKTLRAANLTAQGAPVNAMAPTWSPDGNQIAFAATTCPSCGRAIYKMNARGGKVTRLGAGTAPSWSAKGQLAFTRRDLQGEPEITLANQDGTGVRVLPGAAEEGMDQVWSPDGTRLAFAQEIAAEEKTEIFIATVRDGRLSRVTNTPQSAIEPSWSPDGTRLAFAVLQPDFTYDIDVINADGTGLRAVVRAPGNNVEPAWSPDGKRLAFATDRDSPLGFHRLYVVNADGTGLTRLTGGTWDDSHPSWSPDGTQIVFSRRPSQCVTGGH